MPEVLIDLNQKVDSRTCTNSFVSSFIQGGFNLNINSYYEQKNGFVEKVYSLRIKKFQESFRLNLKTQRVIQYTD